MTIRRDFFLVTFAALLILAPGCTRKAPGGLGDALALYRQNKLAEALPIFQSLAASSPADAEIHAWLAETYRRLDKKELAVTSAREALAINPRSSFAHTVLSEAVNPMFGTWPGANADTAWAHLRMAVEDNPGDGNAWLLLWTESIRRGDPQQAARSLRNLIESGFLSPAALAYGRWMLRAIPQNAILLTNGDMDTFPSCALQTVHGFRTDIAIVNRSLLNDNWYTRYMRDTFGVPMPFDDSTLANLAPVKDAGGKVITASDRIFLAWLQQKEAGTLERPLCVAPTVDDAFRAMAAENLRYAGAFFEWSGPEEAAMPDTAAIHNGLDGFPPDAFKGAWVSDQDRSPIRRVYTKNIVCNVTAAAVAYAESLIAARRFTEARQWIEWAEQLERSTEANPSFTGKLKELRDTLSREKG